MSTPDGISNPALMSSMMLPRADEYVAASFMPASQSAKRLTA
jgi:hypothetical protein